MRFGAASVRTTTSLLLIRLLLLVYIYMKTFDSLITDV